jgi:hypothetical protein
MPLLAQIDATVGNATARHRQHLLTTDESMQRFHSVQACAGPLNQHHITRQRPSESAGSKNVTQWEKQL